MGSTPAVVTGAVPALAKAGVGGHTYITYMEVSQNGGTPKSSIYTLSSKVTSTDGQAIVNQDG